MRRATILGLCLAFALAPALAQKSADAVEGKATPPDATPPGFRNGLDIYRDFRDGLAEPECDADAASVRWRQHFAHVPRRLASGNDDVLPMFGYVVDAVREADLPTEFALIPFVESGYRPSARSAAGPAGLWQMIAITARDHGVPMRNGYDGRLSAVDSTQAAVRYLKTLHGMFAGDWRLAVMAYNAGEYRVLGALKKSGQVARNAQPEKLTGLSDITRAYVRKLHALSCLIEQADDRDEWLHALDRPVPRLQTVKVDVKRLDQWATRTGQDAQQLRRLNPVFVDGRITTAGGSPARLLAMAATNDAATTASVAADAPPAAVSTATPIDASSESAAPPRRHTVARGESAWTIARRYGIAIDDLMQRNGLPVKAVLRPGQRLVIDAPGQPTGTIPAATGSP
ncbi:transglycosylase SLT domain-containing protein [Lysobacter panacisoli]|uniref:lytic transglycosylase domain-containing protein n=1 Tax=Lysobacter panacisoli TaxID=1255263 RepID=UPI003CCCD0DA